MQYAQLTLSLVFLALGYVLIFWGLRLFRLYITLNGILTGAGIGMLVGAGVGWTMGRSGTGALVGALALGVTGGLAAWPLRKLLVFLASGLAVGLPVMGAAAAVGASTDVCITLGLALFVISGVTAVVFYQRLMVVVVSLGGVWSMATAFALRTCYWSTSTSSGVRYVPPVASPLRELAVFMPEDPIEYWAKRIGFLLLSTVIYVVFAVYLQKLRDTEHTDVGREGWNRRFRHLSYLYACLALCAFAASAIVLDAEDTTLGDVFAFGPGLWTMPIYVLLSSWLISRLSRMGHPHAGITKYTCFTAFVLVAGPVISTAYHTAMSLSRRLSFSPSGYYLGLYLIRAPLWLPLTRYLFALVIFPCLVYLLFLKPERAPFRDEDGLQLGLYPGDKNRLG